MESKLGEGFLAVFDGIDRESFERKELREDLSDDSLVVDDEDASGGSWLGRSHE
jgi:hypothetical protein